MVIVKVPLRGLAAYGKLKRAKSPHLFSNPFGRKFCNESDKPSQGCFSEVSESMLFASRLGSVTAFSPVPVLHGQCQHALRTEMLEYSKASSSGLDGVC